MLLSVSRCERVRKKEKELCCFDLSHKLENFGTLVAVKIRIIITYKKSVQGNKCINTFCLL